MQNNTDIQHLSQLQKTLTQNPYASQRELASSTNLSLGMTNALLKRFSDKGWLYMKKISARNIQYVLTSEGLNKLMRRSSRYFQRTARLMKDYKDIIWTLIESNNYKSVVIIGNTDLEFLFDFACTMAHIPLVKANSIPTIFTDDTLFVFCDTQVYNEMHNSSEHTNNIICIANILQEHTIEQEELLWQAN